MRGRPSTHDDAEYIEKRAKTPKFHDLPTKAECKAMNAPPKKDPLAKPRLPMSALNERSLLSRRDGWFLKLDAEGFTPKKEFAYFGTDAQIAALIRKHPEHANLFRVPYVTAFGIGVAKRQDPS